MALKRSPARVEHNKEVEYGHNVPVRIPKPKINQKKGWGKIPAGLVKDLWSDLPQHWYRYIGAIFSWFPNARPSQNSLADQTGVIRTHVNKMVAEMVKVGLFYLSPRYHETEKRRLPSVIDAPDFDDPETIQRIRQNIANFKVAKKEKAKIAKIKKLAKLANNPPKQTPTDATKILQAAGNVATCHKALCRITAHTMCLYTAHTMCLPTAQDIDKDTLCSASPNDKTLAVTRRPQVGNTLPSEPSIAPQVDIRKEGESISISTPSLIASQSDSGISQTPTPALTSQQTPDATALTPAPTNAPVSEPSQKQFAKPAAPPAGGPAKWRVVTDTASRPASEPAAPQSAATASGKKRRGGDSVRAAMQAAEDRYGNQGIDV